MQEKMCSVHQTSIPTINTPINLYNNTMQVQVKQDPQIAATMMAATKNKPLAGIPASLRKFNVVSLNPNRQQRQLKILSTEQASPRV